MSVPKKKSPIFKLLFTAEDRKEHERGGEKVNFLPQHIIVIVSHSLLLVFDVLSHKVSNIMLLPQMSLFSLQMPSFWFNNFLTTRHNKGCNCKRSGEISFLFGTTEK